MNDPGAQAAAQAGQFGMQGAQIAADQRGAVGSMAMQAGQQIGQQLGQMQEFSRQMQVQEAQSAGQLQMWQSERQLNYEKLRQMQALDVAENSRLQTEHLRQQVESATLQNQSAQFEFDQKKKLVSGMSDQEQKISRYMSILHGVNLETMVEMGIGVNKEGRLTTDLTDDEKQAMLERIEQFGRSKMRPLADTQARDMGAQTNAIREQAALLRDQLKGIQDKVDQKDPAALQEAEQIRAQQKDLSRRMSGMLPGGSQQQQTQVGDPNFGPTLEQNHPLLKEHLETALQRAGVKDIPAAKGRFWNMVQNEAHLLQGNGWSAGDAMERALTATLADVRNGIADTMGYIRGKK